jgi:hypothetical protein
MLVDTFFSAEDGDSFSEASVSTFKSAWRHSPEDTTSTSRLMVQEENT